MTDSAVPGIDLQAWLEEMTLRPLPGGVAAAAVAASMGAALVAKAGRVSLRRGAPDAADRALLQEAVNRATALQPELVRLAQEDAAAYGALLRQQRRTLVSGAEAGGGAWKAATEIPLQVAETSEALLRRLGALEDSCWPGVCADFEIACWLLEIGVRAGLLAVESNLKQGESQEIRERFDKMRQAFTNGG